MPKSLVGPLVYSLIKLRDIGNSLVGRLSPGSMRWPRAPREQALPQNFPCIGSIPLNPKPWGCGAGAGLGLLGWAGLGSIFVFLVRWCECSESLLGRSLVIRV